MSEGIAYNAHSMTVAVRSFAKINLGLYIGARRADGYHDLRTVYQTIALHDVIRVSVGRGSGIEILCDNPRVPLDSSNTCYRIAAFVMGMLGAKGRVRVEIEKRLPVQGGLGAASSNAVATMVGLERALKKRLSTVMRLHLAAGVGSDLPLFLVGGTILGVGRGEEAYPLPDLAATAMVVVTPEVGVSTPRAFADWDALVEKLPSYVPPGRGEAPSPNKQNQPAELRSVGGAGTPVASQASTPGRLTHPGSSDRLFDVGCVLSSWLSGLSDRGYPNTGASAKGGSRAGNLLSDLVRTGIENDFERVVFPQYPELRDVKGALESAGAGYASLSGSGSSLYGLFRSTAEAAKAASGLRKQGLKAVATTTLTRPQYWRRSVAVGR